MFVYLFTYFFKAQYVVKQNNDIEQAMKFMEECKFIKIEDILPFFPDFVTIDHFKDAVCSSLNVRIYL